MTAHNRRIATAFVAGSLLTVLVVFLLYRKGHPLAALTVLELSPVPCPPGVPC